MIAVVVSGIIAVVVVRRRPRTRGGRVLATLSAVPALLLGGWMWSLDVGTGARFIGFLVFAAGVVAAFRVLRGHSAH